jgi:hypothetical protein
MDIVVDFIKIILPAGLVMYAMFLTFRNMLDKELERKKVEARSKLQDSIVPLRLQAYERLALLLERISPKNLILRLNNPSLSAQEFQILLIREIREEFNHNLSQQIYISEELWTFIKKGIEDTISTINQAAGSLEPQARSVDLTRSIFEKVLGLQADPVTHALSLLKKEVTQFY